MVSPTWAWAGPLLTMAIFGWIGSRWWSWWSQTSFWSGSSPHAVAVLMMGSIDGVGTVKSLVRVLDSPMARLPIVPIEPTMSSVTATLVRAVSPVLVTLNV